MFAPFVLLPLFIVSFFVALFVGIVLMVFAVIGGPGACDPGGGLIVISEQNADTFQAKWDAFEATLDAGSPATVTFTESEVSSRTIRAAEGPVDDQDWVQGFRVCLHDGYGEISGTVNLPVFTDVKFKLSGTARIEDTLQIDVDDVQVGSLPGFLDNWIGSWPDDTADVLDEDDFEHNYVLTLREGEAQIDGAPAGQAP